MAEATAVKKTSETRRAEEVTINEKLYAFIQKNRRILLVVLVVLVAFLVGLIITVTVQERIQVTAFTQLDELDRRYNELRGFINTGDIIQQAEIVILLGDLSEFTNRVSGFPAARAYAITASIHSEMQAWSLAQQAWSNAASAARRSYFAPISLFNAAVAAEEQGNIDIAINYYNLAIGFGTLFHFAPRAQFAIGRLEEERNNISAALAAYRSLLAEWPNDPVWANLAQNRIIMLSE